MTYAMVMVFMVMFGYIIYFMLHDSEKIVANSSNRRQDQAAEIITRGDIITSDGYVVAHTEMNEEGDEVRRYPYGSLFAHTVGYNDYGRSGIELSSNFDLMKSHVNIAAKVKSDLQQTKKPGDNVITTLDYDLQKAAADTLGEVTGAVVVLDASTSKILAMYSNPTFDPNDMATVWEGVHSEEGQESSVFLNRATQGLYAPGSTFKVITAMEYIKEHPDNYEDYSFTCNGSDIFSSVHIKCAGSTAHGNLDLTHSLARSCNTSFANIGVTDLDIAGLCDMTDSLLFNSSLSYDGEYSKSKFELTADSPMYDVPQTVIGQGNTLITPLHNAMIMQSIANGGIMMKPLLVDRIESAEGTLVSENKPTSLGSVLDPEVTKKVIPMLQEVCLSGTASSYMSGKAYTVAGKTGTAEYDNFGNCNSWFVGYTNIDEPDIVVSVIIEDYNINALSATYVASQIMDIYYNGQEAY